MTTQSTYARLYTNAFAGQPGDSGSKRDSSANNGTGSAIPAGILVVQSATEGVLALPAAATDKLLGLVLNTFARNPGDQSVSLSGTNAIVAGGQANVREVGAAWAVVEQAMAVSDPVYMRFATNGAGKLQLGALRKDADGVAQVTTITPTAGQNSKSFSLRISFADGKDFVFTVDSDGSMTATEVVTSFKTAMALDAAFTARVVASGTATLILTGQVATGDAFDVAAEGDGAFDSITLTTPPAVHARQVKGARVITSSTGAGVAQIFLDVALDRAFV